MCGIWGLFVFDGKVTYVNKLFEFFSKIQYRGPDCSTFIKTDKYIVGFHRLMIIDTSIHGNQPFNMFYEYTDINGDVIKRCIYVCVNGEIYNYEKLKSLCSGYTYISESDCEVILPLYLKYGSDMSTMLQYLDGEFALSIYDVEYNKTKDVWNYNLWLARDRFGIRPLFYTEFDKGVCFGSELKSIISSNNLSYQLEPRKWFHWGNGGVKKMGVYYEILFKEISYTNVYEVCRNMLIMSVVDRLHSDREIGCLLSGGLDSSLIAAIACRELKKTGKVLKTFSVGMPDSPDVRHAYIVAEHIGSDHTNFEIPIHEWISSLNKVIEISETFDITTIRATTGQYLISKKISETTDIKVLLVGDGSDELTGGYLYFHKAPNSNEFNMETKRLIEDIHYFDVLRADRGIASNGLEARVPFLSHNFVDFYFSLPPDLKMPREHTLSNGKTSVYEKYLLRKSFDETNLLPECILWRRKEAFSDGVSSNENSWYSILQNNIHMSDDEFNTSLELYKDCNTIPKTKEALYYMNIFNSYYPNQNHIIPYYWMPKWISNVHDPSARTLSIYNE